MEPYASYIASSSSPLLHRRQRIKGSGGKWEVVAGVIPFS
jgi:hypothetical protein